MMNMQPLYVHFVFSCIALCLGWNYTSTDGNDVEISFLRQSIGIQKAFCPQDKRLMTLNDLRTVRRLNFNNTLMFWINDSKNLAYYNHGENCTMGMFLNHAVCTMNISCTAILHVVCIEKSINPILFYQNKKTECMINLPKQMSTLYAIRPNSSDTVDEKKTIEQESSTSKQQKYIATNQHLTTQPRTKTPKLQFTKQPTVTTNVLYDKASSTSYYKKSSTENFHVNTTNVIKVRNPRNGFGYSVYFIIVGICSGVLLVVIIIVFAVIIRRHSSAIQNNDLVGETQISNTCDDSSKPSASCSPYSIVEIEIPLAATRHNLLNDIYSHARIQNEDAYDHTNFTMRNPMLKHNVNDYETMATIHSF